MVIIKLLRSKMTLCLPEVSAAASAEVSGEIKVNIWAGVPSYQCAHDRDILVFIK